MGLAPVWADAPRFGADEPLPAYRFVPGRDPHPTRDPRGHSYGREEPERTDDEALRRGIDLYHAGYLWEAHEVWEEPWKRARDPRTRSLFRGLIQLVAALLKTHLGEERGVRKLMVAARRHLVEARTEVLDLEAFDACFALPAEERWSRAPRLRPG